MLYVVPTPIGNLEDITLRALRVLKQVNGVLAEDTRRTSILLQHFDIHVPIVRFDAHTPPHRLEEILQQLASQDLALVSDAGMPGIADPGELLIRACWTAGVPLEVLPGANACLTALVGSGLSTERFIFEGFLPARGPERQARLARWVFEERTIICYEAPHRLQQTLSELAHWLGSTRRVAVARELTKVYAELWQGTLSEALAHFDHPRGEFTLVVEGAAPVSEVIDDQFLTEALQGLIGQGLSPSQAARLVAQQTGVSRKRVYQLTLGFEPIA